MSKKMLIDAGHPEETRVVVIDGSRVEDFDYESQAKRQLRGNIYLARVTRVEPSLQAAFVEYGGNRQGFLSFNEIHPDYYQIPFEDRQTLLEEERAEVADAEPNGENADNGAAGKAEDGDDVETDADGEDDEVIAEVARRRRKLLRKYKIQEVIKRRQILLIQVVKEERGNKGAALTTYLSLAGRYCVLMPNTARGGGISRKITSATDRKRLKKIVQDCEVPDGMGLIVRTAGSKRTKSEIRRDYDYLIRLWETIREDTLKSVAPCLIYEESNLVRRAIRDLYDKDIETILVEGDAAYREAKDFIRMLMPSHARKVQHYKENVPLFLHHRVEDQLEQIYHPTVQLKSGGYLVINQTEALVAIDVNSGRATRERNIEATALKTNLEAAEEACRQFRLRDLAGLIVIDFIDQDEAKNTRAIEKRMRDHLKHDRARIQMGKISGFGLMELSRQRRRASLLEGSHTTCLTCEGRGLIRSVESSALHALRTLESEAVNGRFASARLRVATPVALYLLNEKRANLNAIESRFGVRVMIVADDKLVPPTCEIDKQGDRPAVPVAEQPADAEGAASIAAEEPADEAAEDGKKRRRRRRRRRGGDAAEAADAPADVVDTDAEADEDDADADAKTAEDAGGEDEDAKPKRRRRRGRRGRRGGRARRAADEGANGADAAPDAMRVIDPESETEAPPPASDVAAPEPETSDAPDPIAEPVSIEEPAVEPLPAIDPVQEPEPADAARELEPVDAGEPAAPIAAAPPPADADDEARRERWRDRLKSWLGT